MNIPFFSFQMCPELLGHLQPDLQHQFSLAKRLLNNLNTIWTFLNINVLLAVIWSTLSKKNGLFTTTTISGIKVAGFLFIKSQQIGWNQNNIKIIKQITDSCNCFTRDRFGSEKINGISSSMLLKEMWTFRRVPLNMQHLCRSAESET